MKQRLEALVHFIGLEKGRRSSRHLSSVLLGRLVLLLLRAPGLPTFDHKLLRFLLRWSTRLESSHGKFRQPQVASSCTLLGTVLPILRLQRIMGFLASCSCASCAHGPNPAMPDICGTELLHSGATSSVSSCSVKVCCSCCATCQNPSIVLFGRLESSSQGPLPGRGPPQTRDLVRSARGNRSGVHKELATRAILANPAGSGREQRRHDLRDTELPPTLASRRSG